MAKEWYQDFIFKNEDVANKFMPRIKAWRKDNLGSKIIQTVNKLDIIDYDKTYEECRLRGAKLVPCGAENDSITMGGSIDDIVKMLFMSSDGNLNFIASCKCGHLKGNYNVGQTCPKCKSVVRTSFADEIDIHAWIEIPEEFPPFLHPAIYRILDKWIGAAKRKVSILDCMLNASADIPPPFNTMFQRGGIKFFYENFPDIIKFIADNLKKNRSKNSEDIFRVLRTYGQPYEGHPYGRLFCRHIPILNQSLHVLTHAGSMTYNDDSSEYILQTCLELHNMIQQVHHRPTMSENVKEQHLFATYKSWIDYTNSIITDKIQGKRGFIRKNILGNRVFCSGRGVIVPITAEHWADEVELPWRMVVGLYKLEIINLLKQKFGLNRNVALRYWTQSQVPPSEDEPDEAKRAEVKRMMTAVNLCLKDIWNDCPYKGTPIIMGRNPCIKTSIYLKENDEKLL